MPNKAGLHYKLPDVRMGLSLAMFKRYNQAAQVLARLGLVGPPTEQKDWRSQGNCHGKDPDTFFPPAGDYWREERDGAVIALAKSVCASCVVSGDCLRFAYEADDRYAVMAGTTPDERQHPEKLLPEALRG